MIPRLPWGIYPMDTSRIKQAFKKHGSRTRKNPALQLSFLFICSRKKALVGQFTVGG
jgi:hypothetical protein